MISLKPLRTPCSAILVLLLLSSLALSLPIPCRAEQAGETTKSAAIQAEVKKSFSEGEEMDVFIKQYCAKCHGHKKAKAGINYQRSLKNPGKVTNRKHWSLAVTFVDSLEMPPDDEENLPTDEERKRFIELIKKIKYLSPKDPGPFVIRRLSKVEYGNTLRDLLGVDPSIADDLPDEVTGEGYLNSLAPLQSEQYLGIANAVVDVIFAPEGKAPTETQKKLFGDTPAEEAKARPAAKEIAQSLAHDAFRRPPSDSEVDVLLEVYDLARENGLSHMASLRLMVKGILVSPQFLFITPSGKVESEAAIVPLGDYQLASRLSYLLWSTMPDRELFDLAKSGKLNQPETLRKQVKRMLLDDRSRALFDGFGTQWLGLEDLETKTFDADKFPQMTAEMRLSMLNEARMFFESIVRENQSVVRFVDSDYSFLNAHLATLYGLEKDITGSEMRRVSLKDSNRGGILGMPAILATTSFPNRTSPVNRGVWVLEQVLGEHIPPAPPNVPTLEKQDQKKVANLTLRERTELHQTNASCANCHRILDPIGFGLENFDAIGRWRDQDDTGGAIDASGELPSGEKFKTPRELKAIIAARKDKLARNLTEKLLAYALCRQLEGYDEVVVDNLMDTIAADDYRMQTLITEIVTSYPFTQRRIR